MRTKRSSLLLFVTACTLLVTVNACETTSGGKTAANKEAARVTFDISQKPPDLQSGYQRLEEGGQQDAVLNWMRLGVAALQKGYLKEADQAFTEAIRGIERIYADSEQARKARSLWIEEGSKIFKGEPYERVMAYYYSGLVQILKGDYQNARARFKGGMLQDAFAEEEQFRCDFALMSYLAGWCSLQIPGDTLSGEWFEELKLLRPDAEVPSAEKNLLLVLETGTSPRKVSDGLGHYQLKFRRGRHFRDQQVRFSVDGGPVQEAFLLEDVFWQASTRGGRQFDHILAGKASFKKQSAEAGAVLGDVGVGAMHASNLVAGGASQVQGIGAGIAAIGVLAQASAMKAKAEADTRYWDNLPDRVHVASLSLPPGSHRLKLMFFDENGSEISELTREYTVEVPQDAPLLFWARSASE